MVTAVDPGETLVVSEVMAAALARGRERFNAQVAATRRERPGLKVADLHRHLVRRVDPVIQAVAMVAEGAVDPVLAVAFTVSLRLLAGGLLPASEPVWIRLPRLARWLVAAPEPVMVSLLNGAYQVGRIPAGGGRVGFWIQEMAELAEGWSLGWREWLAAGQVVAWRGGMAHLREAALGLASELPPDLAGRALGLAPGVDPLQAVAAWRREAWWRPEVEWQAMKEVPQLRVAARVGGFRGLGGPFLRPPLARRDQQGVLVSDGESVWRLYADRFGTVWLRWPSVAPWRGGVLETGPFRLQPGGGQVTFHGQGVSHPELKEVTSAVVMDAQLVVTTAVTHEVWLLAVA